jgi:multidrug transporter EmrE-like cation transporter
MAIGAADWARGIGYSIIASLIGGASKLAIRKSWLMVENNVENISEPSSEGSQNHVGSSSNMYFEISQFGDDIDMVKKLAILLRLSGMIGMTFLNPLFCVLAMNYASPSILAPFSGLTLVWIVLFSETMIGEKPQRKQIMAAGLIILGEVIVAIFGDHTNDEGVELEDVLASYQNVYFQAYFLFMTFWIGGILYIISRPKSPTLRRFAW